MTDTPDDEARAFARELFTDPDQPAVELEPPVLTQGNVVRREGTNPGMTSGDDTFREFTRRLFDGT